MDRILSRLGTLLLSAALSSLVAPAVSHATMIAIYSRPGEPLAVEEAALLAQALKGNPATPQDEKFIIRMVDISILSPDFSVPPRVSAYFWSDETFEYRGFTMEGVESTFETANASTNNDKEVTSITIGKALRTELLGATLDSKRIEVRYVLSAPGRVSLELYDLNGSNLGRWNWRETASGSLQHTVDLNPGHRGIVLMRWNYGDVQTVRKIRLQN